MAKSQKPTTPPGFAQAADGAAKVARAFKKTLPPETVETMTEIGRLIRAGEDPAPATPAAMVAVPESTTTASDPVPEPTTAAPDPAPEPAPAAPSAPTAPDPTLSAPPAPAAAATNPDPTTAEDPAPTTAARVIRRKRRGKLTLFDRALRVLPMVFPQTMGTKPYGVSGVAAHNLVCGYLKAERLRKETPEGEKDLPDCMSRSIVLDALAALKRVYSDKSVSGRDTL